LEGYRTLVWEETTYPGFAAVACILSKDYNMSLSLLAVFDKRQLADATIVLNVSFVAKTLISCNESPLDLKHRLRIAKLAVINRPLGCVSPR
jgi:hypothetical protein